MTIVSDERKSLNSINFAQREEELNKLDRQKVEADKRDKQSPFNRWTQFNNEHSKELMWLALKHPKAHALLIFLVDQMDQFNAVMCSMQVIQDVLGIGRTSASQAVKVLKDHGYIAVLKSGTSNVYAINDNVYWKSWGNRKKYSKFPANVVLAMSEQDEDYQMSFEDIKSEKLKTVVQKGE